MTVKSGHKLIQLELEGRNGGRLYMLHFAYKNGKAKPQLHQPSTKTGEFSFENSVEPVFFGLF